MFNKYGILDKALANVRDEDIITFLAAEPENL